jgi:hypothetical protein
MCEVVRVNASSVETSGCWRCQEHGTSAEESPQGMNDDIPEEKSCGLQKATP